MNEFSVSLYDPQTLAWDNIAHRIEKLEYDAFGSKGFRLEELSQDFAHKTNIIVLLWHKAEVIGFTYAKPVEEAEPERASEKGETVWIWDTVIQKQFQGRRLAGLMMSLLEPELKRRGYKYIERLALVANNYAMNVEKNYKDRIVSSYPADSKWGPQIFFRIKL